jgi:hypothetical protein
MIFDVKNLLCVICSECIILLCTVCSPNAHKHKHTLQSGCAIGRFYTDTRRPIIGVRPEPSMHVFVLDVEDPVFHTKHTSQVSCVGQRDFKCVDINAHTIYF